MNLLLRSFGTAALAASFGLCATSAAQATEVVQTQAGLHLSRAQAEALDRAMPGYTIWVDVACCDEGALDDAVATAEMFRIVGGLSKAAPVFITGRDPGHAARAVDRLVGAGMALVFLVDDDRLSASDTTLETP